jgi:hypothetical protein
MQYGHTVNATRDFDILPPDVARAAERLTGCLLRGKTPSQRNGSISPCRELRALALGQYAFPEARTEAIERTCHALDRRHV